MFQLIVQQKYIYFLGCVCVRVIEKERFDKTVTCFVWKAQKINSMSVTRKKYKMQVEPSSWCWQSWFKVKEVDGCERGGGEGERWSLFQRCLSLLKSRFKQGASSQQELFGSCSGSPVGCWALCRTISVLLMSRLCLQLHHRIKKMEGDRR